MMTITALQRLFYDNARTHGFHPKRKRKPTPAQLAQYIALLHSEASEALECVRNGEMKTTIRKDGKPEGFPTELADLAIRLFDTAEACGINLSDEMRRKHAYNVTRPRKHGGKVF
jgi:NTP pyrophosphatase (non-canonical NTP hydrolase)